MNKQPSTVRTYLLRGAFLFSLAFVIVMPSEGGGTCPTPWELVADMPLDLYGAAGASDGTYSYHAGGYSFSTGNNLNTLYRYDPVADSWTTLAPMPDAVIMASAVYYPTTNTIYVFGGEDAVTGVNSNATRIYNIASNTWSAGANMPDVRSFMGSGYNSANGKIYLVSGYNTGLVDSAQPDTWEYDPVANTFTSKLDFPHPAGGMASGFINGLLYVAGGRDAANLVINLNWAFDPVANTWTARADMPGTETNVRGSGVALDNLWVFGGGNPFGPAGSTTAAFTRERVKGQTGPDTTTGAERYDPATDSWSTAPNLNGQRSFTSGAAIGAKLVAAGGFDGLFTLASAETLDACISGGGGPSLVSAASVKGPFAIDLPLAGPSGVEDRSGGPNKKYSVVMTFDQNIASVGSASSTCGSVQSIVIDSFDPHKVKLNLVNVAHGCNGSTITVTADSITDDQGNVLDSASVGLGLLLGDVNGDRVVNRLDTNEAQMHKGEKADEQNFHSDVNANGHIEYSDIQLIRQQQGTSLP